MKRIVILIGFMALFLCACTNTAVTNNNDSQAQTLTTADFIVTDGTNSIRLDSPYLDFKTTEIEHQLENNYVGETYSGDFIYKTYLHQFPGFALYVSNTNYNLKNRNFDDYYITQITLKNQGYKTARGIAIGAETKEIQSKYGAGQEINTDDETGLIYKLDDMELFFKIGPDQKVQEIVLSIIADANTIAIENPFFFKNNITQLSYQGNFSFDDVIKKEVKLNINEIAGLKYGKLYELKLEAVDGIPDDRLQLGYFYVQKDTIYKIEPTDVTNLINSEEVPDNSVIVCQEKEIKDTLSQNEPGWHHYLEVNGDKREFHAYNNQVSTGYYESFVWEKDKGLTDYRSGYGAESDSIELQVNENQEIQYGLLSFDLYDYHIVSDTLEDNVETFECEIDTGIARPESHITITIWEIEKPDLPDTESIVSYLNNMSPDYERIRIYDHVTDDSGIVSLYNVTGKGQTNYIVYYRDAYYSIQSNYSSLEIYLFEKDHHSNYEEDKQEVKCADSFVASVNETIYYHNDEFEKAEYNIIQGKYRIKYIANLNCNKKYQYLFTLKNENGENLLDLSTYGDFYEMIKFFRC